MKLFEKLPAIGIVLLLVSGAWVVVSKAISPADSSTIVDVKIPELSKEALAGKEPFDANCSMCHGKNGSGSDQGPPLIHTFYNPGHHSDDAFFLAAQRGVGSHHWNFGNMPPQPQVSKKDVASIISYIRELQRANGIFFKKHMM